MRTRQILFLLITLIVVTVAMITGFVLCVTMLLLVLDTHNKFALLCTVFCFAIFIWTCKDIVYVYRCALKEIKEYFSFRFQRDKYGFEKEDYCEPKREASNKYKKGE